MLHASQVLNPPVVVIAQSLERCAKLFPAPDVRLRPSGLILISTH